MTRRLFLGTVSGAAVARPPDPVHDDYPVILAHAERAVEGIIERQILDPARPDCGGQVDPALGFADYRGAVSAIHYLLTLYSNRDSRYFRDPELLERVRFSIRFLAGQQNPNGTVDLAITNFDSPPDTAFAVRGLLPAYRAFLSAFGGEGPLGQAEMLLRRFLTRGCDSMVEGGIHTPNHRWVVAAALAEAYSLFQEEKYRLRAGQWLREGVDVTPEGEYTERSNGVYNPIVNGCLIAAASFLNRPELLEPVRRNLELMLYMTHPDGDVVTDYSRRQDRGTRARNSGYYLAYKVMGVRDGNGQFAAAADAIVARERDSGALGGSLAYLMLEPELRRDAVPRRPLPESYERLAAGSGVARIRRAARSATIVSGFPSFFSLRHGDVALESVSLISAFFGKGQFVSPTITKTAGGYVLSQALEAYYYDALRPEDIVFGEWSDAEREAKRRRTNRQKLAARVTIGETESGFRLDLGVEGPRGLPVLLSLGFRGDCNIQAEPEGALSTAHDDLFLERGLATARAGRHAIRFGPGRRDHTLVQMRGAAPFGPGLKLVHLAWRAPVAQVIAFRCL